MENSRVPGPLALFRGHAPCDQRGGFGAADAALERAGEGRAARGPGAVASARG